MTTTNGTIRTHNKHVLPKKIEEAFKSSETRRGDNKTSRLDYASGYEDGYRDALDTIANQARKMQRELLQP